MVEPTTIEKIYVFQDLLDEALKLVDLTNVETVKELIEILPGGFHRTELRVLLQTLEKNRKSE